MSILQSINGINAANISIDVIGNNIANSSTIGFKSNRVIFSEMFTPATKYNNKVQSMGVHVDQIIPNFSSGGRIKTERDLDLNIKKEGFFRVKNINGKVFYTKNGQFQLDNQQNITNMQGMYLTGYNIKESFLKPKEYSSINSINLGDYYKLLVKPTKYAEISINLNKTNKIKDNTIFNKNINTTFNEKTSFDAYDSFNNKHQITLYFLKNLNNIWTVYPFDETTNITSQPFNLEFDLYGTLKYDSLHKIKMGAINQNNPEEVFDLDMKNSLQQNIYQTTFSEIEQNGHSSGDLIDYQIENDGTIVGTYSNGKKQSLAKIAVATFMNPEKLKPQGENLWSETDESGTENLKKIKYDEFNGITSRELEKSNVDINKELLNMIVAQRNYQSNAQAIKAQDKILDILLGLK